MPVTDTQKSPLRMPPAWWCLCLAYEIGSHFLFPGYRYLHWPWTLVAAAAPFVYGMVITSWADRIFKRVQTTVKPHNLPTTLVIEGPFKMSRNPMYVGMGLILLGVALFLGTLTPLLGPIVFWALVRVTCIPLEERNLERQFGQAYVDYKAEVRRWI